MGGNLGATNSKYAQYREAQIENGKVFQDFVQDAFLNILKIPICTYGSKLYQHNFGESATGVEIKYDMKFRETGNLYIEFAEKAFPRPGPYAPSGIMRDDNTWLYVIGDYDTLFIFSKRHLKVWFEKKMFRHVENGTKTSLAMLLPVGDCEKRWAVEVLYPNATKKVGKGLIDLAKEGKRLYQTMVEKPNRDDQPTLPWGDVP